MKFNFKSVVYFATMLTVVGLTSCNKDDGGSGADAPSVTLIELGEKTIAVKQPSEPTYIWKPK